VDEQLARNERRDRMYQGVFRMIKDKCPGCQQEFEGRRWELEGKVIYHKGRCKLFKAWNVITDLSEREIENAE
jgi:hypothetical protein